jgi:hypothetical protein
VLTEKGYQGDGVGEKLKTYCVMLKELSLPPAELPM